MLCDICHKNIATVHLTEIINDKVVEMHICKKCAKMKTEELKKQLNISDFLGGLVDIGEVERAGKLLLKCSSCGLSYQDFKKKGRLGCQSCYVTFRQRLLPLLRKIHGSVRHTGKFPLHWEKKISRQDNLRELKERLERAVKLEEYEEAAALRDEIRKLEKTDHRPQTIDHRPDA